MAVKHQRWKTATLATAFTAAMGLAPFASAATTVRDLPDPDVRAAIEGEFLTDSRVPFNAVDVEVSQGIVTLSGDVDTILARKRAVDLARTIKGVRAVIDKLNVTPVPRSDGALRQDVERAMLMDPAADSYEVHVEAANGVVTLSGTVDSWQEKQIVQRVAEGVKGVKEVRNHVKFDLPTARPDHEISAEIEKRMSWDARVDDGLIHVAVDDGTVKLTGTVGSALEKAYARGLAWVPGVKEVDDSGLEVEWWARDDMRREKYVFRSDEQLEQAVKDAFVYDPRVLSFHPDVDVDSGVVTLSGTVDNLEARRAAEEDARNTVGVIAVRNHLRVRPSTRYSDEEITQDVQTALARDPFVDRFDVGVTTYRGDVALAGTVDSVFEKEHAETVTSGVKGVLDVRNNLHVSERSPYRSDLAIEQDIEDELFWSPFVDSDEVNVTVQGGVATLTGTVDTWADRSWAAQNARDGGAIAVHNQIKVKNDNGAYWAPF